MEYRTAIALAKIAFILYKLGLIPKAKFSDICDTLTIKVLKSDLERRKNAD